MLLPLQVLIKAVGKNVEILQAKVRSGPCLEIFGSCDFEKDVCGYNLRNKRWVRSTPSNNTGDREGYPGVDATLNSDKGMTLIRYTLSNRLLYISVCLHTLSLPFCPLSIFFCLSPTLLFPIPYHLRFSILQTQFLCFSLSPTPLYLPYPYLYNLIHSLCFSLSPTPLYVSSLYYIICNSV